MTWDLLSDDAKAITLGLCKDPGKRVVNLHKVSAFDFLQANLHESLLEEVEDPVETPLMKTMQKLNHSLMKIPEMHSLLF